MIRVAGHILIQKVRTESRAVDKSVLRTGLCLAEVTALCRRFIVDEIVISLTSSRFEISNGVKVFENALRLCYRCCSKI